MPLSSWGAFIFSLLIEPIQTYQLGIEPFTAFLLIIPANYYAIMALLIVFLTIFWKLDFPLMKAHEEKAMQELDTLEIQNEEHKGTFADATDLLAPIMVLIASTIIFFLYSGGFFTSSAGLIAASGEGNIVLALVYGGILATITAAFLYIPAGKITWQRFFPVFLNGVGKMMTAAFILILAWSIGQMIEQLETGVRSEERRVGNERRCQRETGLKAKKK